VSTSALKVEPDFAALKPWVATVLKFLLPALELAIAARPDGRGAMAQLKHPLEKIFFAWAGEHPAIASAGLTEQTCFCSSNEKIRHHLIAHQSENAHSTAADAGAS
jgi:hypothetical protein